MKALAKEMPVVAAPSLTESDVERFWSKVSRGGPDDCWPWMATSLGGSGHGGIRLGGRKQYAHRVAFFLGTGVWPGGLVVRHDCDNPICCNVAHLRIGTQLDNIRDRGARGRHRVQAVSGRVLTPGLVIEMRRRRAAGDSVGILAADFGVTHGNVYRIVNHRTWKHL